MRRAPTGRYLSVSTVGSEPVRAFVPNPLPPTPAIQVDAELRRKFDDALLNVGRLDSVSTLLPDTHLFIYMYVRKEAVLSSQIEGMQSSLSDLLLFEMDDAPGALMDDVVEVSRYVSAMQHGLDRLAGGFPISNRLIREIHDVLLSSGRGADKDPGQFRRSQNWIGGTRPGNAHFVPAPPGEIGALMGHLEHFLHDKPEHTPTLLKAALSHVQFETIHPFLDGNGRVGRLLITLLLCNEGMLSQPLLYLSLYFKQHRARYYQLLDAVRANGEWEEWVAFFMDGVAESARGAVQTARRLSTLVLEDRAIIRDRAKGSHALLAVQRSLEERPVTNITQLAQRADVTFATATRALATLEEFGLVQEMTGRKRNRVYQYAKYLRILSEGTEPL